MNKPTLKLLLMIATLCTPVLGHAQEVPDEADPIYGQSWEDPTHYETDHTVPVHRNTLPSFTVTQQPNGGALIQSSKRGQGDITVSPMTPGGTFVVNQWGPHGGFRTCLQNFITHQITCN